MSLLGIFWTMLWFFLFVAWIWLLITVFTDLFHSDMSGLAKAAWVLLLLVFPLLGVLIYLLANGDAMQRRAMERAAALEKAQRAYIKEVAASAPSPAEELARLAELKERGVITEEEFQTAKARVLA